MGCIIFHRREYDKNRYIMKDSKDDHKVVY